MTNKCGMWLVNTVVWILLGSQTFFSLFHAYDEYMLNIYCNIFGLKNLACKTRTSRTKCNLDEVKLETMLASGSPLPPIVTWLDRFCSQPLPPLGKVLVSANLHAWTLISISVLMPWLWSWGWHGYLPHLLAAPQQAFRYHSPHSSIGDEFNLILIHCGHSQVGHQTIIVLHQNEKKNMQDHPLIGRTCVCY